MGNFKWLHLSDLHFRVCEGFDMNMILDRLQKKLEEEAIKERFNFIFITGDLADRCDYTMTERWVRKLLLDSGILKDDGQIFWVCGNHDIPRKKLRIRENLIGEIRDKEHAEIKFENEFADEESRDVILRAFNDFYKYRELFFEMDKGDTYPHKVVHMDEAEIVLLNTCLTSCDDDDEHRLYLCEPKLIALFHEIEQGKPVFVLGHHSLNYLVDSDRMKLLNLFRESNVSAYLCGHSHQLGVYPLSDNIFEIVSGGFQIDGHAVISFFVGNFDEGCGAYELIPYTYRSTSMIWDKDYSAVAGIQKGKKYQVSLADGERGNNLVDLTVRSHKLFLGVRDIENMDIKMFNRIGERVLEEYVQILTNCSDKGSMKFDELCEVAMQNGSRRINYTSLKMTDTMKDVWRFRENLVRILHELKNEDINFPIIKETYFDFNEFFAASNRFDRTENLYVLVTDAVHDMDREKAEMLTKFQWDMILDYDGYSENDGLRSCVSGQNIKDLVGDYKVVRESILRRGIISWIRIGEKVKFSLSKGETKTDLKTVKKLFQEVSQKLYEQINGAVVFVFMKDIETWDKELMRIAWERFEEKAKFIMVGAFDKQKLDKQLRNLFMGSYGESVTDCYEVFQTSTAQFLKMYSEYSEGFLEKKRHEDMLFPSNNGLEKLDHNLYVNLEDFFEVLTLDIGKDTQCHEKDIDKFYLGSEAAWSLFYTKSILELIDPEVMEDLMNKLRTVLGAKQDYPRKAIFYLLHIAGFGGTTMAKMIAWKMHQEWPTVILKNYEYGKIRTLIQNLYDNHSRKGIFIIADESRFLASDLESLEQEMGFVDRPFALLIVKRLMGKGKNSKNIKKLNLLSNEVVDSLKIRFRSQSHLDPEVLKEKDERFNEVFPKRSDMRCPFLIGLYYQDKQFSGIPEYVKHILKKIDSESELKLLMILSIINYYGRIGVTREIVKKYVPLSANSDYLEKYLYAKEAFIRLYDETMHIGLYCEKHNLISLEMMNQCSKKLYQTEHQECLKEILEELIHKIMEINHEGVTLYYKNLLERLFIYKNATDVDEEGETDLTEFSPLILALPSQDSKEEVMCMLANSVYQVADRIVVEGNDLYFKMSAHICGHLGRLYKASPISMKLMENGKKSIEWCERAENIMKRGGFEDAYIYHMYGTSLSRQCQDKLHEWTDDMENCSREEILSLEYGMEKALEKFNETIYAGEFVRGCISKLSLLMEYIQFLMKWKKIGSADELGRLSDQERSYIKDIDELINMLEEMELDSKDEKRLQSLKNKYKSEIIFNNYGKAVEYYTNSIKNVINEKGEDAEELFVLRSGLVGAILGKYKQEEKNPYLDMQNKDIERILEALEKNIFSTTVLQERWDRQRRCNDCNRWLKVAKQSSAPIITGIRVAEKWKDLQNEVKMKDPRPYYYLSVLHYLNVLDGYPASFDLAQKNQRDAYRIANNSSSFRIIKTEKIRDILIEGKGMGQLKSVIDISEFLEQESERIIKIKGKFVEIEKNPKIGVARVTFPQELKGLKVFFRMGEKNTISINQTTHMLEFGVGFTFERLEAINNTVKDIS